MTDAPERILVDETEALYLCAEKFPDAKVDPPSASYVRADLYHAAITRAEAAEEEVVQLQKEMAPATRPLRLRLPEIK